MAIYYARANGNVNGTIWATTPGGTAQDLFSSFNSSDTLMANSFTVNINVNTTVLEVRSDNANSATAGGTFAMNTNGVTLAANVVAGSTNNCVTFSLASPNSVSIVGNITGGTGNAGSAVGALAHGGTGTVSITGNVTAGSGVEANAIRFTAAGTLNITGNMSGSGGSSAMALVITAAGTANITGNVTGGSGASSTGINPSSGASTVNITGNVVGGSAASTHGVLASVGTLTVVGTVTGGSAATGITAAGTASVTLTRARGNGFGNGSTGVTSQVGVNNSAQTSTVNVFEIEYGDLGQSPTAGAIILLNATSNVALFYRTSGGKKTLIDSAASAGHPVASNVRSGVVYANGNQTGTLAVPAAGSVALGVAVDNTTGTATLTPAAVWDYLTTNASTSGSMGERLRNAATVSSVGQALSDAFG